jgi:two-component system nitrogen regulation sensor histidine kinase GlnL
VAGTVLNIRDVTESMLIEERMRRMERFMGLGSLAAGLHHEINNPLSALLLHVRLLEERLNGNADEEIAETLGIIKTEVTRIVGVLQSFRDYASIDKLSRAPTDVVSLVQQTMELVRPQANQQQVRMDIEWNSSTPRISADASRLGQVLLNLVLNALDEMPHGGKLGLRVDCSNHDIHIDVEDTGRGIPDNVRARIFDPYFTTKNHGSGMGLAFCDKIVREHGGQIDVMTGRSGTVFRVVLPIHQS